MAEPVLRHVSPYDRRGRLYLALAWFSATRIGGVLSMHIAWKLDPLLLRLSRGRICSTGPIASAVLETRGARSGQVRRSAIMYFHDGDQIVIVASNRGLPHHPGWFHNLRANREAVFAGRPFRADIVRDEAEVRRLWPLAEQVFPQHADFRRKAAQAGRDIPIIQLVEVD